MLQEFREWIKKGALKKTPPGPRPARYNAKYESLDKPHDLGVVTVDRKSWYYELATSPIWLWDEHIDVAFYYLRKKIKQFPKLQEGKVTTVDTYFTSKVRSMWTVYRSSPATFDWGSCETLLGIMLGVSGRSSTTWFEVNTLLIPLNLQRLEHWVLVKLELTNWTIEVYDSMQHEGPHNQKVRDGVECLAGFIPLLAGQVGLFDFKPREPPGTYPIPVTIRKDIPKQGNGGDCGVFTIKIAECLIEGRDVSYWVLHERMQLFRDCLACYFWAHAHRKLAGEYKSDDETPLD